MVTVPTSNYNGEFSLGSLSYTAPTTSSPDVTFINNNDGTFSVNYDIINLVPPFDMKWLVKSGDKFYTILDGVATELNITQLTSTDFQTHGIDMINWDLIKDLPDPELFYWYDNVGYEQAKPSITVNMSATPLPQVIISDRIDLTDTTITGIESATVTCEGNPLFCVSFDEKQTWKAWNGTEWATVTEELSGMTKELFESIVYNNWLELYANAEAFYIKVILTGTETTQSVSEIYIDFSN
jgi:hypothetical protein